MSVLFCVTNFIYSVLCYISETMIFTTVKEVMYLSRFIGLCSISEKIVAVLS